MKYIKLFEDVKSKEEIKKMLNDIFVVHNVIEKDLKRLFDNHNIEYIVDKTIVVYDLHTTIFDIVKRATNNDHYYLPTLEHYAKMYNTFDTKDLSLRYNILTTHTDATDSTEPSDDFRSLIETVKKKYDSVILKYIQNSNSYIDIEYRLDNYLKLIRNNYLKINKE